MGRSSDGIIGSKLPEGALCINCSNYLAQCRDLLKGQSPFDGKSRYCYFSPSMFNVPWGYTLPKEELDKLKEYRKHR